MGKSWLESVAEYAQEHGDIVMQSTKFQIHHVVGRKGKQNKVLIGPYFILPLWWALHDVSSNHPHNVTHWRHEFTKAYGTQRELFSKLCENMKELGYKLPPEDILKAIQDTDR